MTLEHGFNKPQMTYKIILYIYFQPSGTSVSLSSSEVLLFKPLKKVHQKTPKLK